MRVEDERGISRQNLARAARDAGKALDLRPSLRMVLSELAGCWGEHEIEGRLMVWPSNDYLMSRTGLSERAIRLALRGLIGLTLIAPRDSANGKRFAIKGKSGSVIDAYGFDLAPLISREAEFAGMILEAKRLRDAQARRFDAITISRRAIQEALSALASAFPDAPQRDLADALQELAGKTPRRGSMAPIDELVEAYDELRTMAEQRFYDHGNAGTNCRHIETDNDFSGEACNKRLFDVEEAKAPARPIDLALLIEACPVALDYVQVGRGRSGLIDAARFLRASIGAHESAFTDACETIGVELASAAVFYVLQMHTDDTAGSIRNPGGYYRALTRMIAEGRFNLGRELANRIAHKRKQPAH